MLCSLLINSINQLERPAGILAFVEIGFHPDREKLRAEVAFLRRIKVQVAAIERIGKIVILIDQPLCGVSMSVDHNGLVVYGKRVSSGFFHRRLRSSLSG